MISRIQALIDRDPALAGHIVYLAAAALALGGAWSLQIFWDLYPCPLCLEQREPWYAGVMISAIVLTVPFIAPQGAVWKMRGLVPMMALLGWGLYKSTEHVGVEYGWWASSCVLPGGGGGPQTIEDLLRGVATDTAVPCDAVQWEFLGVTLAGYNFLMQALVLVALAWLFWKAWKAREI
jgi:disulfide bond formation protein DsbB